MLFRLNTLWSWLIIAGFLPLVWLILNTAFDNLGGNPIQALHIRLGDWSLRFLYLTLAITPLQKVTQWRGMADYRQMLGLYAFFYATLHLLVYVVVDHGLMWRVIGIDIVESSYIWFGILAYSIIFGLALTSSKWAKKRMGKNWKKFHRFIYIAAIAAIIHYFWQLKGNLAEPLFYSLIIFLLLGFRVLVWLKNRKFSQLMIPGSQKVLLAAEKKAVVSSKSNKLNVK
ncbi:MAG: protein-methionine-sulfoxide reductase heme-binding subunit MsrQ [Methylobacter sp.]|nr:protein-methionine-sulfoxide reductase heme-binding subunit MsrQ [Methylobacter sp.]MDP2099308.1 protein-methionine-sulfoxide reductase heme-binding subunit MsrQ [Methylobacter sp.]MDP2428478.1 protein-methionine-sulfoxide reductase heme-binding subunit MsrQ [Methylobacter sp.]MDP3055169.1 protein-methionine-sulfoxide reductase heme-binding subunit MsrQ [Methylobacter sp.]MDP3363669.1 protein-methionine-sulfoxide reductase heme-binding subunit MsrQ [Methylobacter sp.]